ncbi:glutathione S-transferase [Yoonia maricola]|uniref:Glutathione S-transferase n=1 Tax=Yoonia maricola TaxID=420999 RepID=A0A2M8W6B8_9RHOB|nr:glutathione S-transferase family protein [Yoonia maricola]PJI86470.1 glutathione S-transferase [Yoonia maricola]
MAEIETKRDDIRQLRGVHLFHNDMSNCSQRVRLALCVKGVAYESHPIDLQKHENLTPEFRALNPKAVVPVLVHDGRTYIESNDIVAYVEDMFDDPLFWPDDAERRAITQDLLARSADLQSSLKLLTYEFLLKPVAKRNAAKVQAKQAPIKDTARERFIRDFASRDGFSFAQITAATTAVKAAFDHLEDLLSQSPFLKGADFGLADISWLPNVHRALAMKYPLAGFPKVAEWYQSARKRRCFREAIIDFEPAPVVLFMKAYAAYRALRGTGISAFK